jgi:hypothetical protein
MKLTQFIEGPVATDADILSSGAGMRMIENWGQDLSSGVPQGR